MHDVNCFFVLFCFVFFKLVIEVTYIVNPEKGDSGRTGCRDNQPPHEITSSS